MSAWFARHFAWHGYTSRAEYYRWLAVIVPAEILLLAAIWQHGSRGTIHFPSTASGLTLFVVCLAYFIGLLILTARRFRSAGISRGWLVPTLLAIVIPIGPYYWNVSATVMLLAICVAAVAADVPENERIIR
ncbi:DUF805 domain-containing protein [Sphingopyxis sp. NJF-3]